MTKANIFLKNKHPNPLIPSKIEYIQSKIQDVSSEVDTEFS